MARAHAFLGAVASAAGRWGAHPPGWEEGKGRERGRAGSFAEEERREAAGAARSAPEGFRSADLAGAAAAGMLEASPRCQQRHPRSRHGAEGGELRWRDARPAPASSSARPGARVALVCCGGDPGAQRPALAALAAAAASCLPRATSEPQAGSPEVARIPP